MLLILYSPSYPQAYIDIHQPGYVIHVILCLFNIYKCGVITNIHFLSALPILLLLQRVIFLCFTYYWEQFSVISNFNYNCMHLYAVLFHTICTYIITYVYNILLHL